MATLNLRDLDRRDTELALAPFGVDRVLAGRVFAAVQARGETDLGRVRDLPAVAGRAIAARAATPALEVVERRRAADGFVKYLFRLEDGPLVEAVRIPLPDPAAARDLKERRRRALAAPLEALPTAKYTVCVSSQAGCALACGFCATGRLGAIRSLRTWEILDQVRRIAAEADHPVRGVVFMGMGEPLLNYENVVRAARVLADPAGFAISGKAISISTAGVVPAIRRYAAERHPYRLVVSLGAPTSAERARLMPIEHRWPLTELMGAVRAYADACGDRVALAYVMIGGAAGNVTPGHARELRRLLGDLRVRLSLIDVADDTGRYPAPAEDEVKAFLDALGAAGIPFSRRYSGGRDIDASCGTLSGSRTGGALVAVR